MVGGILISYSKLSKAKFGEEGDIASFIMYVWVFFEYLFKALNKF